MQRRSFQEEYHDATNELENNPEKGEIVKIQ